MIDNIFLGGVHAKALYVGSSLAWKAYDPVEAFTLGKKGLIYDPSDLSTLFMDAEGTIPVTSSGDPVGRMLDKSGNGNHAIQTVSTARPTYHEVDGLHFIKFDGIDDYLYCNAFSAHRYNTIALAIKKYSSHYGWFIEQSVNSNTRSGFYVLGTSGGTFRKSAGNIGDKYDLASNWSGASGSKLIASYCYDTTFQIYKNSVLQPPTGVAVGLGDDLVTDTLYINSRGGNSLFSNNDIYGLVIVDGFNDRVDIEKYLAMKSGVAL